MNNETFVRVWNACRVGTVAQMFGISYVACLSRACALRKRGFAVERKGIGGYPLGKPRKAKR